MEEDHLTTFSYHDPFEITVALPGALAALLAVQEALPAAPNQDCAAPPPNRMHAGNGSPSCLRTP